MAHETGPRVSAVRDDARASLHARERELSAIYQHIPGILFYVRVEPDGDFRFLSISETGLVATGLGRDQIVGALVRDVIPPASRDLVLGNYREAIRSGRTVRWKEVSEYPAGRKIGEVAVTPLFDAAGAATHLVGIVHDITEREMLEQMVRALRDEAHTRELTLLLETATQGIVSVDRTGTIVSANPALEAMFGWEAGELIGTRIELLMPAAFRESHAQHRADYFAVPRPRLMGGGLRLVGQRKNGSTFPIEVSLNHVMTPDGGRVFAFVTDITERQERTLELERRTLQLSRLASDLTLAEQRAREQLATLLHDGLQQLLVSASLDVERRIASDARPGVPPDQLLAQVRLYLEEAIGAARSLSLELFPPVLHTSGLPAALRWLSNQTRIKYHLRVDVVADTAADSARRDVRTLLFESVRELVFNAVKHARADCVTVHLTLEADDSLCIVVADRGVGFDPADLDQRETAGWGLFSIRERLALLGGRLEIDSAPGRGSRFRLIAPRGSAPSGAAGEAAVHDVPVEPARDAASALRIVLVDDHPQVREAYRRLLADRRELSVVGDAADGFEAIAQARALRPDVILMDISMPNLDGIEATRRIRAELPSIAILGLSTQPRGDETHPIEEAGAIGFFTKGVDTERLVGACSSCRRLCGSAAARAGVGRRPVRAARCCRWRRRRLSPPRRRTAAAHPATSMAGSRSSARARRTARASRAS
jgi:PAS domain S-box-containing protein